MESLVVSTGVVALAEIGDKTQLLAFILAARFKKPLPIILGILVATLINHGLAGALGAWITSTISPNVLRWVLGASFIAMAIWTMIPDKIEEEETQFAQRFAVLVPRSSLFSWLRWAIKPRLPRLPWRPITRQGSQVRTLYHPPVIG